MSAEEAADHIARVDKALRKGKTVETEERSYSISGLYERHGWGGSSGPTPLPGDGLKRLKLEDKTADNRWSKHFLSNGVHIGLYRSLVGYYWLLRYDTGVNEHLIENVGTAADAEERFR